jgi:hypothetical protein
MPVLIAALLGGVVGALAGYCIVYYGYVRGGGDKGFAPFLAFYFGLPFGTVCGAMIGIWLSR